MKTGGHRSIVFTPPANGALPELSQARPAVTVHAPAENDRGEPVIHYDAPAVSLYHQPEEDILLLGEMIRDIELLTRKARSLPTSGVDGYRGELRVMRGAARRIIDGVDRLLGEAAV